MNTLTAMGTVLFVSLVTGCSSMSSDINYPPKSKHFTEQDEPTISIKPLPVDQPERKKTASKSDIDIAPPAATNVALQGALLPIKPEPKPQPQWNISLADRSIRALFDRWCKDAGYQLLWEVSVDLQLGASATITGTFEEALNSVLVSLNSSEYPIEAMIYDNRVVRVVKHIPKAK